MKSFLSKLIKRKALDESAMAYPANDEITNIEENSHAVHQELSNPPTCASDAGPALTDLQNEKCYICSMNAPNTTTFADPAGVVGFSGDAQSQCPSRHYSSVNAARAVEEQQETQRHATGGSTTSSHSSSYGTQIVNRLYKKAGMNFLERLPGRRSSTPSGTLHSTSDSTVVHSTPLVNVNTIEFAIDDMLPPNLVVLIEDDMELLQAYRLLQIHASVALCLGFTDVEELYHLRVALVQQSVTRKQSLYGSRVALGSRRCAVDKDSLSNALSKGIDLLNVWVNRFGDQAKQLYEKYVDLYIAWGSSALYTQGLDIFPYLLQDMQRFLSNRDIWSPSGTITSQSRITMPTRRGSADNALQIPFYTVGDYNTTLRTHTPIVYRKW